jgi:hypothetical protein
MGPLSLRQAIAIANESQFMVSHPFDNQHPDISTILCITVCPYRQELKQRFLRDYHAFGTTDLTEYIEEDDFDVIVVGRHVARPDEYLYTDLKSFKKENAYQMVA